MRERSIALLALALLAGCIREDRAGCPPSQAGRSVVLKIVDAATGRDITESGAAGEAELFLLWNTCIANFYMCPCNSF